MATQTTLEALTVRLDDPQPQVRIDACSDANRAGPAGLELLKHTLRTDPVSSVRAAAVAALARVAAKDPALLEAFLAEGVAHASQRIAACLDVGALGVYAALRAEIMADGDPAFRRQLLRRLHRHSPDPALVRLALRDGAPEVREVACDLVAPALRRQRLAPLAIADPSHPVRLAALAALAKNDTPCPQAVLLDVFEQADDETVRHQALLWALSHGAPLPLVSLAAIVEKWDARHIFQPFRSADPDPEALARAIVALLPASQRLVERTIEHSNERLGQAVFDSLVANGGQQRELALDALERRPCAFRLCDTSFEPLSQMRHMIRPLARSGLLAGDNPLDLYQALAALGPPGIATLRTMVQRGQDSPLRRQACQTLGLLGSDHTRLLTETARHHFDARLRWTAAIIVGRVGRVPPAQYVGLLKEFRPELQRLVLARLATVGATALPLLQATLRIVTERDGGAYDSSVVGQLVTLVENTERAALGALQDLTVHSAHPGVRARCARLLAQMATEEMVWDLDPELAELACSGLLETGEAGRRALLRVATNHSNATRRTMARRWLLRGGWASLACAAEWLSDPSAPLRLAILQLAVGSGEPGEALRTALTADEHPSVRQAAWVACAQRKMPSTLAMLLRCAQVETLESALDSLHRTLRGRRWLDEPLSVVMAFTLAATDRRANFTALQLLRDLRLAPQDAPTVAELDRFAQLRSLCVAHGVWPAADDLSTPALESLADTLLLAASTPQPAALRRWRTPLLHPLAPPLAPVAVAAIGVLGASEPALRSTCRELLSAASGADPQYLALMRACLQRCETPATPAFDPLLLQPDEERFRQVSEAAAELSGRRLRRRELRRLTAALRPSPRGDRLLAAYRACRRTEDVRGILGRIGRRGGRRAAGGRTPTLGDWLAEEQWPEEETATVAVEASAHQDAKRGPQAAWRRQAANVPAAAPLQANVRQELRRRWPVVAQAPLGDSLAPSQLRAAQRILAVDGEGPAPQLDSLRALRDFIEIRPNAPVPPLHAEQIWNELLAWQLPVDAADEEHLVGTCLLEVAARLPAESEAFDWRCGRTIAAPLFPFWQLARVLRRSLAFEVDPQLRLGSEDRDALDALCGSTLAIALAVENRTHAWPRSVPPLLLQLGAGTLARQDYPTFALVSRPAVHAVSEKLEAALRDSVAQLAAMSEAVQNLETGSVLAALVGGPLPIPTDLTDRITRHACAYATLAAQVLPPGTLIRRRHIRRFWQRKDTSQADPPQTLAELRSRYGGDPLIVAVAHALLDAMRGDAELAETLTPAQRLCLREALRHLSLLYRRAEQVGPEPRDLVDHLVQALENAPLELSDALGIHQPQRLPRMAGGARTNFEESVRRQIRSATGFRSDGSGEDAIRRYECRPLSKAAALKRGDLAGDCSNDVVPNRALSPHHIYYGVFEDGTQKRGYLTVFEAWGRTRAGERHRVLCVETINVPLATFDAVQPDLLRLFDAVARSRGLQAPVVVIDDVGTWNFGNVYTIKQLRRYRGGSEVFVEPADPVLWLAYEKLSGEAGRYCAFSANTPMRQLSAFDADLDRVQPENVAEAERLEAMIPHRPVTTAHGYDGEPIGFISAMPAVLSKDA